MSEHEPDEPSYEPCRWCGTDVLVDDPDDAICMDCYGKHEYTPEVEPNLEEWQDKDE